MKLKTHLRPFLLCLFRVESLSGPSKKKTSSGKTTLFSLRIQASLCHGQFDQVLGVYRENSDLHCPPLAQAVSGIRANDVLNHLVWQSALVNTIYKILLTIPGIPDTASYCLDIW